jgi:poly-beta-1,6-N-acetyl-D-glucosamine synthase
MSSQMLSYVLVTAARNEEDLLEQTIQSVVSQTVLPLKWAIVSDGSTDRTDEIVASYAAKHPWIVLVRMPDVRDRSFAAKVQCFNAGFEKVKGENYDIVANLDADITFESDYFSFLLSKFMADPKLGVAGTPFVEGTTSYDFRFTTVEHVSGACQLFRRDCFSDIGGYIQVKGGGIDWIAVTTARMKGWKTRTFTEMVCHHHRPMGTASAGRLKANFKLGTQDYYLGGHLLWEAFRSCYQMTRKPYLIGGLYLFAGYCWAWMSGTPRPVSAELVRFHQHEQMQRLSGKFLKPFKSRVVPQTGDCR